MTGQYRIKYNRTTVHIDGVPERTKPAGEASGGVVGYYARSACPALTRSGRRMATYGPEHTDPEQALAAARGLACNGLKVCRTCEAACTAAATPTT